MWAKAEANAGKICCVFGIILTLLWVANIIYNWQNPPPQWIPWDYEPGIFWGAGQ